ncbi:MAG: filamentous hemagglutinin N-terminal domain-containing protein [Alphaproteobacteria bacterium]
MSLRRSGKDAATHAHYARIAGVTDCAHRRLAYRATSALTALSIVGASILPVPALALPQDGNVIEGDATITYGENSIVIQQNSDRVIIEWQSFDVGANESVNFIQPSELAAALNRVLSGEASVILAR